MMVKRLRDICRGRWVKVEPRPFLLWRESILQGLVRLLLVEMLLRRRRRGLRLKWMVLLVLMLKELRLLMMLVGMMMLLIKHVLVAGVPLVLELTILLVMVLRVVKLGLRLGVAVAGGAGGKGSSEGVQFVPLALIKHGGPSASAPGPTERARQKCPSGWGTSVQTRERRVELGRLRAA